MIQTGGGRFDPREEPCIFLATSTDKDVAHIHENILIAVNELKGDTRLEALERWLAKGTKIFLDSGIFNLTNEHARAHDVTMDEALALAPDQIDGFDALWDRYVQVIGRYGDQAWGYIELDQGGRENKIKTRAKLEALGLRPIPVYHPINDGWDYFDYLAERYDRICFGNLVQADQETRQRLVATAWERHRKYPDLWIHLLGYTPDERLHAWPVNSADSSTWLSGLRWAAGVVERVDQRPFSELQTEMRYKLGADPDSEIGAQKAVALSAYAVRMHQIGWRHHLNTWASLGCSRYPHVETA